MISCELTNPNKNVSQMYLFSDIASMLNARAEISTDAQVRRPVFDTRLIVDPEGAVFFAIKTETRDGHRFIPAAYEKGVRYFVVSERWQVPDNFRDASFIFAEDTLKALQAIAGLHRQRFSIPVIAITGSNGKTIVKDWLGQALSFREIICRSPRSYNSQIGVPVSVLQLKENTSLAVFEAGISYVGEMGRLERIIRPTLGILTNIGAAHQEHFESRIQKLDEKLKLFTGCKTVFMGSDDREVLDRSRDRLKGVELLTWGRGEDAELRLLEDRAEREKLIVLGWKGRKISLEIPFRDRISVENLLPVVLVMLYLGCNDEEIKRQVRSLQPVAMRMELKDGINGSLIINDSYNSDINTLELALSVLEQNQNGRHKGRTLILSDMFQTGIEDRLLYPRVAEIISKKNIDLFIGVGSKLSRYAASFPDNSLFFTDTDDLLDSLGCISFKDSVVLIKGARQFRFERLVERLELKLHSTVLEVNIDALLNNFRVFKKKLKPGVKTLAMVKAFGYGSGLIEISSAMQLGRVDYLGVAFADEGVELRQAGINTPIIVMNPEPRSFALMLEYGLEPEVYSYRILEAFNDAVNTFGNEPYPIHIKLDSGMHRLGFYASDGKELISRLKKMPMLKVKSVFSHLAGSDEEKHDEFTLDQLRLFDSFCKVIEMGLGYSFIRHILNSAGVERFSDYQFEMVRLGIGLYGISSVGETELQNVLTLKTYVSQIKEVEDGGTIGYGRKGHLKQGGRIAVLPIGYADGLNRGLSNGKGMVRIGSTLVPIVGNICMDSCMIDVSDINVKEGDEVVVFGDSPSVMDIANALNTIPYEVLTGINRRVKRVYYRE